VREAIRALEAMPSAKPAASTDRPMTDGDLPPEEGLPTMRLEEA
jgi:hypothetical protein